MVPGLLCALVEGLGGRQGGLVGGVGGVGGVGADGGGGGVGGGGCRSPSVVVLPLRVKDKQGDEWWDMGEQCCGFYGGTSGGCGWLDGQQGIMVQHEMGTDVDLVEKHVVDV